MRVLSVIDPSRKVRDMVVLVHHFYPQHLLYIIGLQKLLAEPTKGTETLKEEMCGITKMNKITFGMVYILINSS